MPTGGASIEQFCRDGFVVARGAVAPDVVRECVAVIENELRSRGIEPGDPRTWSRPVVRMSCPDGPAFATAGTSPRLAQTYDALLGAGRWIRRQGVGGTIPVRFPSTTDPGDAGWHIDGSYEVDGRLWVNVRSRVRGLLALFLFTDARRDLLAPADARDRPRRRRVHRPPVSRPPGDVAPPWARTAHGRPAGDPASRAVHPPRRT